MTIELALGIFAGLCFLVFIAILGLALAAAAAYGDDLAVCPDHDPFEFGEECDAVVFDFPPRDYGAAA